MSLTLGGGPLANQADGSFNFVLDAPAHRIFFTPEPRRIRARIGTRIVLDTTRGHMLHESAILPVLYVPADDLAPDVLSASDTSTHCPFKGDASYRHVTVDGRRRDDAVWAYEEPLPAAAWLRGLAALDARQVDEWFVEDESVFGHLKDRFHRVDVHESSRPVRVRIGGELVAESRRPKLLFETGLPTRAYVPRADVRPGVLTPTATTARCPYKGESTYASATAGDTTVADAAWGYEAPLPDALKVQGHVCFDDALDGVEVHVGEPPDRF